MIKGNALRHQMVFAQQREIYDYWRSKCRGSTLPSRADIEPHDIPSHLKFITLTEPVRGICPTTGKSGSTRFLFRLAGTGFYRFYNDEIQGRHVDELPIGCRADYWHRVLSRVVAEGRPYHGVTKPQTPVGSHLAQFYLRLPLSEDGVRIDTILGYDHIVPLEGIVQPVAKSRKVYA